MTEYYDYNYWQNKFNPVVPNMKRSDGTLGINPGLQVNPVPSNPQWSFNKGGIYTNGETIAGFQPQTNYNNPPAQKFPSSLPQYTPQRSSNTHAIIDFPLSGQKKEESPFPQNGEYSYGIQYFPANQGRNLHEMIAPVIYPQAWRPEHWAQDSTNFSQINLRNTDDITEIALDYPEPPMWPNRFSGDYPPFFGVGTDTRGLPSSSLGVPSVSGNGYFSKDIGYYTAKDIGINTRDNPQPTNPLLWR